MPKDFSGQYPIHKLDIVNSGITASVPSSVQAYREELYQQQKREEQAEEEVGYLGGLKHSALGTVARVRFLSDNPFGEVTDYIPTDEQRKKILEAVNYNEDAYNAVARRLNSADDIDNAIEVIRDNIEYNKKSADAGILDNLASGLGEATVDPVNWAATIGTGGWGMLGRVAAGGVSNAASGWINQRTTGVASDLMMDAATGIMFGAGAELMSAASRKFYAKAWVESMTGKSNFVAEGKPALGYFENSSRLRKFRVAAESFAENLKDGMRVTVNGMFEDIDPNGGLRKILDNFVKNEAGIIDPETGIHRQYGDRFKTAEEYYNEGTSDILRLREEFVDDKNKMTLRGISTEELSDAMYKVAAGKEIPERLKEFSPQITAMAKKYRALLDKDNMDMIAIGKWENGAIDSATYVPRVWDVYKISDALRRIGGTNIDAMQNLGQRLAHLVYDGTRKNPQALADVHKAYQLRLKDELKGVKGEAEAFIPPTIDSPEFAEWMMKEATEFALGVVDQGKHINSVFDPRNPLSSFGDGGKHRIPWDTSFRDVDGLCLDDFRVDFFDAVDRYHRRATGELIAKEVYGADGAKGLQDMFNKAIREEIDKRPVAKPDAEARYTKASDILIKKAFGIGLRDYDEGLGVGTALSEILRNLTFATSNSYMGILNYLETSAGVLAYGPSLLLKSIPGFNKVMTRWAKGGMTPAEERGVMDLLFTQEPVVRSAWGDIRRHNRYRFGDHKVLADIVSGTQILSQALPTTKFLQASQINIVDTARGMMLAQIIRGQKKGFFRKGTLTRLNITPKDMAHLKRQLKKAFAVDVKGGISVRDINEVTRDPRALTTLRRLGDYAADETILRPSLGDTFKWDTSASPIIGLLTQFKSFAIRSWSKRAVKAINRVKEGDALYQAGNFSVSVALATIGNLGITAIRTSGMSEEDRERYWQMSMGIDINGDIEDQLLPAVESSIFRSSLLAAPALLFNAAGIGTFSKTTSDARIIDPDAPKLWNNMNLGDFLVQNMPALRTANNYTNLGIGLANYLAISTNPDDYTYEQEQKNINNLWKSFKSITPQWGYMTNAPLDNLKDKYTDLE